MPPSPLTEYVYFLCVDDDRTSQETHASMASYGMGLLLMCR
jgi:hypothetical protein